jgi:hypothetical protein
MKKNPYLRTSRQMVMARSGNPIKDELRIGGSRELAIGSNDELNAGSKRELMQRIGALVDSYQRGEITTSNVSEDKKVQQARADLVTAAINDRNGPAWAVLGEVIGEEIFLTMDREGFSRRLFIFKDLAKGEIGRLKVRQKQVVAWQATSDPNVIESVYRQPWIYPDEFYLIANLLVEDIEIEASTGDLLDEMYTDGLEQIMVHEDQVWKRLADAAAGTVNDLVYFNTFTPATFASMRTQISRWGIPVTTALIAFDLWNDIIADSGFSNWFDPVSKYYLILEGNVGSLLGVELITDAFRYPTLKVLQEGEVYFCGAPQTLGGITQRKALAAEPITKYNEGRPMRGWFLEQIEGMALVNSRAITYGQRV